MKLRVRGTWKYQAWPETVHAAKCMRELARNTTVGQNHVVTAAIVMTAFSIEAFAQTLGPKAYGGKWTEEPHPAERKALKDKLKCIGIVFGKPINLGQKPWSTVMALLRARDALAHPAPCDFKVDAVFEAVDEDHALVLGEAAARGEQSQFRDIEVLDKAAGEIEDGLLEIWVAAGGLKSALKAWQKGRWGVSIVED